MGRRWWWSTRVFLMGSRVGLNGLFSVWFAVRWLGVRSFNHHRRRQAALCIFGATLRGRNCNPCTRKCGRYEPRAPFEDRVAIASAHCRTLLSTSL